MKTGVVALGVILFWPLGALANDLDALALADATPKTAATSKSWQLEWALTQGESGLQQSHLQWRGQWQLAPGLQWQLTNRLEGEWQYGREQWSNSLQEIWLGWQPAEDIALDVGRINQRNGVALGFNPLDVFRDSGVRGALDGRPGSARDSRLGVVMLRGQHWWPGGSLSALYAPRLSLQADNGRAAPDWGRSNHRERWQLLLAQQAFRGLTAQWLLAGGAGEATQYGLALSSQAGQAMTLYGELNTARRRLLDASAPSRWRTQGVLGGSYSTPWRQTIHLEYHYNGMAWPDIVWQQWQGHAYGRYRQLASQLQLAPTRREWFLHATQDDFIWPGLELAMTLRHDAVDDSRLRRLALQYKQDNQVWSWSHERGTGRDASHYAGGGNGWRLSAKWFF